MANILYPGFVFFDGLKYVTVPTIPPGTAGGDLSGFYPNPTVAKLQGRSISATAPSDGYVLAWSASHSDWAPTVPEVTLSGDVTGANNDATVIKLQGRNVSAASPSDGYVLAWSSADSDWEPKPAPSGSFTAGGDLSGSSSSQTVSKIQDVTITGSPAYTGQVLTISGAGAADWEDVPQVLWQRQIFDVTNGWQAGNIPYHGFDYFFIVPSGTPPTSPFQYGVNNFLGTSLVENQTTQICTFGISHGSFSFDTGGTTVQLAPGQNMIIAGDGVNVFTSENSTLIILDSTTEPSHTYTVADPNRTTYLIDNSGGAFTITLPTAPIDGTQYTFKDETYSFSSLYPLTLQSGIPDYIEQSPGTSIQIVEYTSSDLSFTLKYSLINHKWYLISTTKPEMEVAIINYTATDSGAYSPSDVRITDYFIDTSGGAITFTVDATMTPFDGEVISFKDNTGSWNSINFMFQSDNSYIELPSALGTYTSSFGSPVSFSTNGNYVKYMFSAIANTWFIISLLLTD